MTDVEGAPRRANPLTAAADIWERFWFSPSPATTLGLVRIAYGVVLLGWAASLGPDLMTFFSDSERGMVPLSLGRSSGWSVFTLWPADAAVWIGWVVLMLAAVAVVVGWHPSAALAASFVLMVSFQRRNPYLLNSGDFVVKDLAFFLLLCPSGAALSVDRWRRVGRDRFWDSPPVTQWALRLVQIQVSLVYFFTFWNKTGLAWRGGTAVSEAWQLIDLQRFVIPSAVLHNLWVSTLLGWSTLALELAGGVLIWVRRWRPWALGGLVLLHITIDLTLLVGFFSAAMVCGLLAFVPPETSGRWVTAVRRRLAQRPEHSAVHEESAVDPLGELR